MAFDLHFQGPDEGAPTQLELLADAAQSVQAAAEAEGSAGRAAVGGVAIYSFASCAGVRLLLSDPDFSKFLHRGQFRLIVGVDAVTTPEVLTMLADETISRPKLQTSVFLHSHKAALFHPKVSWFYSARSGRSIVGSGNLTKGGLLNNWEAFVDTTTKAKDTKYINSRWSRWLEANKGNLRSPTDPDAVSRALANRRTREKHEEEAIEIEDDRAETDGEEQILIAELPRASNRWNQANFDKNTYMSFFGLEPGTTRRVVLYPVQDDGSVGDPEVRPGVSVKSQNYRIELGQAIGTYPSNGRPIGIFRRIGVRRFRYRILMPLESGYDHIRTTVASLDPNSQQGRMKRAVLSYASFRQTVGTTLLHL